MNNSLLQKLGVPRLDWDLVPRPRLTRLLDCGLHRDVTIVCAPAGYGKTTAVAMWLREAAAPSPSTPQSEIARRPKASWYSLDADDNNLGIFLLRFIAAVQVARPDALKAFAGGPRFQALTSPQYRDALVEACAQLPEPLILVLNDYHLVTDAGIHDFVCRMIKYAATRLHLVVISRHDPPLQIARLRARDQVAEIRVDDLRMTAEEASTLLELRLAERTSEELAAVLQERAEGWVAGLQLAAAAVQQTRDPDGLVSSLRRSESQFVLDYLFDEVLDNRSARVKEFLLKTGLVARFSVELAAAITHRDVNICQGILDQLRREHLFVVALDTEGLWFRYHLQFASMLVSRARATFPASAIRRIRDDAAAWLAARNWTDLALAEYSVLGQWEKAADLVEADRHRLQNGEEWQLLWQRIVSLPAEIVGRRAGLLLGQAWILQFQDRIATIPPLVEAAEALLASGMPPPGATPIETLKAEILLFKASWVFSQASMAEQLVLLQQALPSLSAQEHAWVRGFGYIQLARLLLESGRRDVAYRQVAQEIETARMGAGVLQTRLHHAMTYLLYQDGELGELMEAALRYRHLAARNQMPMAAGWARLALGWAHYQRCEFAEAWEALLPLFEQMHSAHMEALTRSMGVLVPVAAALGKAEEAMRLVAGVREIALERENHAAADQMLASAADAALLRGDQVTALNWARSFARSGSQAIAGQREHPLISMRVQIFAKIVLAVGTEEQVRHAIQLVEAHFEHFNARHIMRELVQDAVLLACCYRRVGAPGQALDWMQRAVDIGWPRGFRQVFFEQGTEGANMLYALVERGICANAASDLLVEYGTRQASSRDVRREHERAADRLIEALSEREVEVLALLAQRHSNKEIARQLDISPLTVRNHTSSIYSKLGVASRKQAVVHAEALGLIASH